MTPCGTDQVKTDPVLVRRLRSWTRPASLTWIVGFVVGAAICLPLIGRGYVLVLDWVLGPQVSLPVAFRGFGVPPGFFAAVQSAAAHLVGAAPISWLVIAACFPVGAAGMARLVAGTALARGAAALFYLVNPFVFERLASGQIYVVVGYALLPWAVRSLLDAEDRRGVARLAPGVWLAVLAGTSVHYAWIAGLVLVVVVAARHRIRSLWWGLQVLAVFVVLDLYLIVPTLGPSGQGVAVGTADLSVYRTAGDPVWGLFVNVAGLYGFWRGQLVVLPKDHLSGWPILFAALLLVAGVGFVVLWRAGRREMAGVLVVSGVLAYLLALGGQGPTGPLFVFAYDHLTLFRVMREPEKFSAVVALAYAVGFGFGVDSMATRLGSKVASRMVAAAMLALPLAYTPTIFGGLDGQLHATNYPASWAAANRLMGRGPGKILFLPWHEYLTFDFTHHHVIANPAGQYFSRTVIEGDNVEVGTLETDSTSTRSAYLQRLYSAGPDLHAFGRLVAQLGVRYVVLADTVDYRSYRWLNHQSDLTEVFDHGGLQVWRNAAALPEGARLTATLHVPSFSRYLALAQEQDLTGTAVFVDESTGTNLPPTPAAAPAAAPPPVLDVSRRSSVSYRVGAGPAGWVLLPEDSSPAWRLGGAQATALVDGVSAIRAGPSAGTVTYATWRYVQAGDAMSAAGLAALILAWVIGRRPARWRRALD